MKQKYNYRKKQNLDELIQLHEETLKIIQEINREVESYRISIKPYIVGYLQYLTVRSYISLINLKILKKLGYRFSDKYIERMYESLIDSAEYYIKKVFFNKSK